MKSSRHTNDFFKKIIGLLLCCAVTVCCFSVLCGVSVSADNAQIVSVNYAVLQNKTSLSLRDYRQLAMADGAGLQVSTAGLTVDGTWFDRYHNVFPDDDFGAYALYAVEKNSTFYVTFSNTANMASFVFLGSKDGISWQVVETQSDGSAYSLKIDAADDGFLKILWPNTNSGDNALQSVRFTKSSLLSTECDINYADQAGNSITAVEDGKNNTQVLNSLGVWDANNICLLQSGLMQPDWGTLYAAQTANSFNGFVTYKVQPNTAFSLTVTAVESVAQITKSLGYSSPEQWHIQFFGSMDDRNYTPIAVEPTAGIRYGNDGVLKRSTDFSFTVPDGVVYLRCKFPVTQNLSSMKDAAGKTVWPYCGNDVMEIDRVKFSRLKYDYYKADSDDYAVAETFSQETLAAFGMASYGGGLNRTNSSGLFDTDWMYQYNGGTQTQAVYDVRPGTAFYAGFKTIFRPNLEKHLAAGSSFVIRIQGLDQTDYEWEDVTSVTVNSGNYNSNNTFYSVGFSGEQNHYNKVRILWPGKVENDGVADDCIGLAEVAFSGLTEENFANGDLNGDNAVNILDIVRLKKILTGASVSVGASPDTDDSGAVDADDLTFFKKYLLGIIKSLENYDFDGKISLGVLNNYLDHAVTYCMCLGNTSLYDADHMDEGIRFLTDVGAKYVQRAAGEWYVTKQSEYYHSSVKRKLMQAHEIDSDIIFEACIFETTSDPVDQISIPDWVWLAFGKKPVSRNFSSHAMLFDDGSGTNYFDGGHLPDITKMETQMFVYYKACQYIDVGFEALHLGQVGLTGKNDTGNTCWTKVIHMIRDYAKIHARRHYVLINAHKNNFVGSDGVMLVDMTVAPIRVAATADEVDHEVSDENPQRCDIFPGMADSVYQAEIKGTSPSGWYTDKYPYLVEFDNYGGIMGNTADKDDYIWGKDEITWYIVQPTWYRRSFMQYIDKKIHGYRENGHVALVGHRGGTYYANYNSAACTTGSGDEAIIAQILDRNR